MTYDEQISLMTALLRGRTEQIPLEDWESFTHFAVQQRLAGGLLLFLKGEAPDEFRARYEAQEQCNRQLLARMRDLHEALGNVRCAFLKGPRFALQAYGGLGARSIFDVDLLVHPQDLEKAQGALLELGMRSKSKTLGSASMMRRFTHSTSYRRDDFKLDLHFSLRTHPSIRLDSERLWATRRFWSWEGHEFPILSPEYDLVLYLLSAVSDFQIGILKLRDLFDLYRLLIIVHPWMDWPDFWVQRRQEHIQKPCLAVIRGLLDYLDCEADFPGLAVASHPKLDFARAYSKWERKWIGFGLMEGPWLVNLGWWMLSLPFRLADNLENLGKKGPTPRLQGRYPNRQ